MIESSVGLYGNVYMTVTDKHNNKQQYHFKNRVVQSGIGILISRFVDCTGSFVTDVALGSDGTPPTGTEAGLGGLVTTAPLQNHFTTLTPPIGGAMEFRSTLTIPGDGVLEECGLFCSGTLFARSVFPPINVVADMTIDINWVISITSI